MPGRFSYFRKMLYIFSSHLFYTKHVCLPGVDDPVSSRIYNNPKFWPYFRDALGALDGAAIFILRLLHQNVAFTETARVLSRKIAYLGVLSISSLYML